jgi:uncharacterized protein YlxW (UPF0749 family)
VQLGPRRYGATVGLVTAFAGLLFAANARLAGGENAATLRQLNLSDLIEAGTDRVEELDARNLQLQSAINQSLDAAASEQTTVSSAPDINELAKIGLHAVYGPGVRISLNDAPATALSIPGVAPDDLVIHQQDIQAVIAALWAGGAEAMTLMGERVTMLTAFRCTGNVLLLNGRVYSPPFIVEAIGDVNNMRAALAASLEVQQFLRYVETLGLGFTLEVNQQLTFEGATPINLAFAEQWHGTH